MINTSDLSVKLIEEVREEYGSPVYVFDEGAFKENYHNLQETFQSYYPKYRIAYSYKTNYTPYICKKVLEYGGLAEVVSDFEYYVAKTVGYKDRDIVYNGPYKQESWKELIENDGILNVDNIQEAKRLFEYIKSNPDKEFGVGIRINIDAGQGYISRFGIEPYSEDFKYIIKEIQETGNLYLKGIHCHIGQSRGIERWQARVTEMLTLADVLFMDDPPEYIDLGSGMFGDMEPVFRAQFNGGVPSYEEYARVVAKEVADHYKDETDDKKPWLYTEPGATLISRYIWLISTVISYKEVRGRKIAGLDCSFFNAGETVRYKRLPFHAFNQSQKYKEADFAGYTCLEDDILTTDYEGFFDIGDPVVIGNTGGYSLVFKPPFIQPDIPMVALREDDTLHLIKKGQTFQGILSDYYI